MSSWTKVTLMYCVYVCVLVHICS